MSDFEDDYSMKSKVKYEGMVELVHDFMLVLNTDICPNYHFSEIHTLHIREV